MRPMGRTMDTCRTCKHWLPYRAKYPDSGAKEDEQSGGLCQSEKLTEDYYQGHGADMLIYPYMEGGEFWTGADFGCVHHQKA
jgi:hypothetical protein